MKNIFSYLYISLALLYLAGCSKNDDTPIETNFFPSEIEFSTKDNALTLNFEYNDANQIKRFTMLSKSEFSTSEYDITADYENNLISSLEFTNLETEGSINYSFDHDDFGIINHINIVTNDGTKYEVTGIYNGYNRVYTFNSDYATWFPLKYRVDTSGYVYNKIEKDGSTRYSIKTIDGQKGIFHALPRQLELFMFFELSYFGATIPYFFSPYTIEFVDQKAPYSDINYENYEYDDFGNPVNFNYVDASTHAEYQVRYVERAVK